MDCSFVRTTWVKAVFLFVVITSNSQGTFVSRKAPKGTIRGRLTLLHDGVTTNCISAIVSSYDEVYPVVVGASDDKVRDGDTSSRTGSDVE